MQIAPSKNGMVNVVESVEWSLIASSEQYSASTQGTSILSEPQNASFVEFEKLTPELVQSWIESSMTAEMLTAYKKNVEVLLNEKMAITTKVVLPPWQQ